MISSSKKMVRFALAATLIGAGSFCAGVFQQAVAPNTAFAADNSSAKEGYSPMGFSGRDMNASGGISKGRAKQIALGHAGYRKKDVKGLDAKFGKRDGKKAVIVKFRYRRIRYNYVVNRKTGRVISYVARLAA